MAVTSCLCLVVLGPALPAEISLGLLLALVCPVVNDHILGRPVVNDCILG